MKLQSFGYSLPVLLVALATGYVTFATSTVVAQENLPKVDLAGFERIFDGKTLNDWDGDSTYWTAEDGKLVGTVTPETLLKKNSWIVYRGQQVQDFELVLDYRVSAGGNSGVGYRLAVLEDDPVSVRGPQADIHGADMFTGICYEENGRRLLAARGQSTWIEPNQLPRLAAQFADPEELQSVVRKDDWNRYRLVVRNNDSQHFVNGVLMSEIHDHDEPNRMKQGLVGVQVHVGPPMKIEFRDIHLKHFGTKPVASAARGQVTYKPGTLREPEHSTTFNHLAQEALRFTKPPKNQPLDGKRELTFAPSQLGIVRSGLVDVKLYGASKPLPSKDPDFDLIVTKGDQTLRVPGAGSRWFGKPLDHDYRVTLQWNDASASYQLKELEAAGAVDKEQPAPIAHWKLDDQGREARDSAGNHHGTIQGAVSHQGKVGTAFIFDRAKKDHVSIPYSPDFEVSTFTISAWVWLTKEPSFSGILGTRTGGEFNFDMKVNVDKVHGDIGDGRRWIDTRVNFYKDDVGSNGQGGDLPIRRWYLITFVVDSERKQCRLYLDDDRKKTISFEGEPRLMRPGQSMTIGDTGAGECMDGVIDEVRIWRHALTDGQVRQLAAAPAKE